MNIGPTQKEAALEIIQAEGQTVQGIIDDLRNMKIILCCGAHEDITSKVEFAYCGDRKNNLVCLHPQTRRGTDVAAAGRLKDYFSLAKKIEEKTGIPFDPLKAPPPDPELANESYEIGHANDDADESAIQIDDLPDFDADPDYWKKPYYPSNTWESRWRRENPTLSDKLDAATNTLWETDNRAVNLYRRPLTPLPMARREIADVQRNQGKTMLEVRDQLLGLFGALSENTP